jgi:hypothetical protein
MLAASWPQTILDAQSLRHHADLLDSGLVDERTIAGVPDGAGEVGVIEEMDDDALIRSDEFNSFPGQATDRLHFTPSLRRLEPFLGNTRQCTFIPH